MAGRANEHRQEFHATHRFARISARKVRLVVDLIRGQSVERALRDLSFCKKRGSPMVTKVLKSAMANATQAEGLEPERLVVSTAVVDEGPTLKRWRPRSMGRAYPRLRRTCHIKVAVSERPGRETSDTGRVAARPAKAGADAESE